ncbi:MAG: hypothetical protein HZA20_01955 [Nitrospirae bacterium]|nr:hypothetical protein [Nitrospirota bacterium]
MGLREKMVEIEREEILGALTDCGWVMAKAARRLGITERMIGYKIKKYGIQEEETNHVRELEVRVPAANSDASVKASIAEPNETVVVLRLKIMKPEEQENVSREKRP